MLAKPDVTELYRKRAEHYDVLVQLYRLIGFRMASYREQAIAALHLKAGDTVVDIACGTGANFPLLQERVGPNGKIIGVDFTDAMLAKALERVKKNQWCNVDLIQSDAASYSFPDRVNGVVSTFAIIYVPEFDQVIRNGSQSLAARGRIVVLDFKLPNGWTSRLVPICLYLTRPWGLSMEMASRHPWESIGRYLTNIRMTELYGGFVFLAVGEQEEQLLAFPKA